MGRSPEDYEKYLAAQPKIRRFGKHMFRDGVIGAAFLLVLGIAYFAFGGPTARSGPEDIAGIPVEAFLFVGGGIICAVYILVGWLLKTPSN